MHAYLSPVTSDSGPVEVALRSEADGSVGHAQVRFSHCWAPNNELPWAAISIVHGFGDHGGRFADMATSLASMGLAVTALDLVGHGRSPGKRGVIESYDRLLDEVEYSLRNSIGRWPRIPQFLFGQSMGGNLVINWVLRRPVGEFPLMGAIVGSPMLRTPNMPREKIMNAGRWLAQRMPNLRIPAPVQVDRLSQDRRAQDAYLRDPWVHRSMSLRLAAGLIDSGLWAIENAGKLSIPMLLMHGTEDSLTCPRGTRDFAELAGTLATFRAWHGCRHDLHDEPQRESVFAFMTQWLKLQCMTGVRISVGSSSIRAAA